MVDSEQIICMESRFSQSKIGSFPVGKVALGSFIIHNQLLRLIINYFCVLYGRHTLGNGIDPDQETNRGIYLGTFHYSL